LLFTASALAPAVPAQAAAAPTTTTAADTAAPFPVTIQVEANHTLGELKPVWRFFGADESDYAYMKDGRKLIKELGELAPQNIYFRAHHLLTSGNGTPALKWSSSNAYNEDAQGNPVYDWTILDKIFDTYIESGVRPYVEVGFMPEALSIHPQDYPHNPPPKERVPTNVGQAYPPKDYAKWGNLAYEWAKHCVERYGAGEVEKWYWEIWNEPNIGYWRGTPDEFLKLHDYAVAGIRRALPTARVGGADTAGAGGAFTRNFIEHCLRGDNYATGQKGTPLDFVSFHAKGSPSFVEGHVRMGISNQLRAMNDAFTIYASYPELKNTPIVIGESDPDGCAACTGNQLGYRNGTLFSSYTAASYAREQDVAAQHGVNLEGALTWAFEFEDQPFFAGYRTLSTDGVDMPVFNVFRMLNRMGPERVAAQSSAQVPLDEIIRSGVRNRPDVGVLASRAANRLTVFVWHYMDDDLPGADAAVNLQMAGLPATLKNAKLTQYRIDQNHSNSFTVWKDMGSPPTPDAQQYAQLEKAGKLQTMGEPGTVAVANGQADVKFDLPRQAVALFVLEWTNAAE